MRHSDTHWAQLGIEQCKPSVCINSHIHLFPSSPASDKLLMCFTLPFLISLVRIWSIQRVTSPGQTLMWREKSKCKCFGENTAQNNVVPILSNPKQELILSSPVEFLSFLTVFYHFAPTWHVLAPPRGGVPHTLKASSTGRFFNSLWVKRFLPHFWVVQICTWNRSSCPTEESDSSYQLVLLALIHRCSAVKTSLSLSLSHSSLDNISLPPLLLPALWRMRSFDFFSPLC